jgi:hypothetical protein
MEGTPTARLRVVDGGAPGLRVDLTERCPAFRFSARPVSDYRFAWKAALAGEILRGRCRRGTSSLLEPAQLEW